MAYLAERLGLSDIADRYALEAVDLRDSIRKYCWDPRDGFYYSVDLNLLPVEKPTDASFHYHTGQPRQYDCLIQRLSVWSGFLAMWRQDFSKDGWSPVAFIGSCSVSGNRLCRRYRFRDTAYRCPDTAEDGDWNRY